MKAHFNSEYELARDDSDLCHLVDASFGHHPIAAKHGMLLVCIAGVVTILGSLLVCL